MKILKISILGILIACLFFPIQSRAQGLRLGVKIGANLDQTHGTDLTGDFSGYFLGGAYVGIQMSKIRIQAEALFSQSTLTTGDNFNDAFSQYINDNKQDLKSGTFKMNELSIPVMVAFNIVPKFLWIEAGPQYTAVVSINDVDDFLKESDRVFKSGYVSGLVGVSLELPLNLNAGVRYVMGFTDRNNTDVPANWKTNHIQIHVGYSFIK
jgi:hypothetical protein